jgi:dipeptidase E
MKLLLTSAGLYNESIAGAFLDLVGLPRDKVHIAFIPTAANVEEGDKGWLIDDYTRLKNQNFGCIDIVDISALPEEIWLPRIQAANVIIVGGGNTYYLMAWLKKSRLARMLPGLLENRVYVGTSAGSIVATMNLKMSSSQKSFAKRVTRIEDDRGMGFVNFHISPHLNAEYFPEATMENLRKFAVDIPEPIYALDDDSAVMVNGRDIKVISEGKWMKIE